MPFCCASLALHLSDPFERGEALSGCGLELAPAPYQRAVTLNPMRSSDDWSSLAAAKRAASMRISNAGPPRLGPTSRQPAPTPMPCSAPVLALESLDSRHVPSSPSSNARPVETLSARAHS